MDQTDVGLRAVVKALRDFVGPAVDPNDPLAGEQLRLSVEYIAFLRQRLDYLHGRERFDLKHQIALAEAILAEDLPPGVPGAAHLIDRLHLARDVIADPESLTLAIRSAALELGHAVSAILTASDSLPPETARRLHRTVLDLTEPRIEFERHWYAPIGFEPVPLDEGRMHDFLK